MKGSCPKKQFCDICQVAGHSLKECPFNLKAKGHQQVLRRKCQTIAITQAMMQLQVDIEITIDAEGAEAITTTMEAEVEYNMMRVEGQ